jgi:hypothetical protein
LLRIVVVVGVGDYLAQTQPQASVRIGRDSPDVLASVALEAWQAKANRLTTRYALAALDRSPLNTRALRMEALGLQSQGKATQAAGLMHFAGTRSWRDDGVQIWLLRDAISRKDFAQACLNADALARRRSDMWPELFLLLDEGVGDKASLNSLVTRLARRPHWRQPFLESIALSSQPDRTVDQLFQMIDKGPSPLKGVELSYYPQRLVREGRYRDAIEALRAYRFGPSMTGSPFDGGFTNRPGLAPFDWQRLSSPGASLNMALAPKGAGDGLRVEYDGRSKTDLMRQLIALQPGNHVLTGDVLSVVGDPHILSWQIRCASSAKVLTSVPPNPRTAANVWGRFAEPFSVPPHGCEGAWLVLAESPSERPSSNLVWFDNLSVRTTLSPTSATK